MNEINFEGLNKEEIKKLLDSIKHNCNVIEFFISQHKEQDEVCNKLPLSISASQIVHYKVKYIDDALKSVKSLLEKKG